MHDIFPMETSNVDQFKRSTKAALTKRMKYYYNRTLFGSGTWSRGQALPDKSLKRTGDRQNRPFQLSKELPLYNLKYFVKREAKLNQSIQEEKLCYSLNISCVNLYLWASTWFSVLRRNIFQVGLSKYRYLDQSSAFSLTLNTLISVSIFSILFTIHFL